MLTEAEVKKFAQIKARFEEMAALNHMAIQKGEHLRMVWSGIVPEVQWLITKLIKAVGDPGEVKDTAPFPAEKKVKKVKSGRARLAQVAANKEFETEDTL